MTVDKYLELSDLVSKMGKETRTHGWDVMVSYKIDRLNALLNKVWDTKGTSSKKLEFTHPSYDTRTENGKKVKVLHKTETWDITMAPPSLRFVDTGAVLQSAVSGTLKTQYYSGKSGQEKKDGDPESSNLSDGWALRIVTPISLLTAVNDGTIHEHKSQGDSICIPSLNKPNIHIVFHCSLKDGAGYSVDFVRTKPDDPAEVLPSFHTAAFASGVLPSLVVRFRSVSFRERRGRTSSVDV